MEPVLLTMLSRFLIDRERSNHRN